MARDQHLHPMTADQLIQAQIRDLTSRVKRLRQATTTTVRQATTGQIDDPLEGELIIDYLDNKVKWYSNGAWRECICDVAPYVPPTYEPIVYSYIGAYDIASTLRLVGGTTTPDPAAYFDPPYTTANKVTTPSWYSSNNVVSDNFLTRISDNGQHYIHVRNWSLFAGQGAAPAPYNRPSAGGMRVTFGRVLDVNNNGDSLFVYNWESNSSLYSAGRIYLAINSHSNIVATLAPGSASWQWSGTVGDTPGYGYSNGHVGGWGPRLNNNGKIAYTKNWRTGTSGAQILNRQAYFYDGISEIACPLVSSIVCGLNDNGLVVGFSPANFLTGSRTFVWNTTTNTTEFIHDLDTSLVGRDQIPLGINNNGHIALTVAKPGSAITSGYTREQVGMFDLNTNSYMLLEQTTGVQRVQAQAINDNSDILAQYGTSPYATKVFIAS